MGLYKFLEKPSVYNWVGKILSLGNQSVTNFLKLNFNLSSDSLILDVGCGTGRYAEVFPGKFFGIDNNKEYIDYAKSKHHGSFLVMDATRLEFPDNYFDFTFNVGVFHHLSDQQVKGAVAEMKRVIKVGGRALIVDAVFPRKINFLGYLLFSFDRGQYTRNIKRLDNLLSQEGFKILQGDIKGSFPYRLAAFIYQK